MLCDRCQAQEAAVHIQEMAGTSVTSTHLCAACAALAGYLPNDGESAPDLSVIVNKLTGKALAGAVAEATAASEATDAAGACVCPGCGLTGKEFRAAGRLGCARCYAGLEPILTPLLADLHRGGVHVGRVPAECGSAAVAVPDIIVLRQELAQAVASEAYERAAALRDELTRLVQSKERK